MIGDFSPISLLDETCVNLQRGEQGESRHNHPFHEPHLLFEPSELPFKPIKFSFGNHLLVQMGDVVVLGFEHQWDGVFHRQLTL